MSQSIIFLFIFCFPSFFVKPNPVEVMGKMLNSKIPWEFKKEKQKLNLFYRWLPNATGKDTRQLKCQFSAEISDSNFLGMIKCPRTTEKWLQRVEKCEIIQGSNSNEWYSHIIFDFPWPMSKRDIIVKNNVSEINNYLVIEMVGVDGYMPVIEGFERIEGFYGYWKISLDKNIIEYSIFSDKKSSIPTWVTDPFIEESIFTSIFNLREIIDAC